MRIFLLLILSLLLLPTAQAAIETWQFSDAAQEQQFRQLTEQLRCPKCQNNSIADSNAMIAADMRHKVYELLQQGKSQPEIINYMVERYGNFVTYQPPVTPFTLVLWVAPVLFILVGIGVIVLRSRRKYRTDCESLPAPADLTALQQSRGWVFIPGALVLIVLTPIVYLHTSSIEQVAQWRQVTSQTPELLQRAMNPDASLLNIEEMARLGLGLRTRLQQEPDNIEGWMMLGRIGVVLKNASMATQAFAHAYQHAPTNIDAKLGYAEVLTRSGDPQDNQLGMMLLRELRQVNQTNVRVLSLLAFNAFEQQQYSEAVSAWQMMLRVLPKNDQRRTVVSRSIEQAKAQEGASISKPERIKRE